jgi:hypothetical protein
MQCCIVGANGWHCLYIRKHLYLVQAMFFFLWCAKSECAANFSCGRDEMRTDAIEAAADDILTPVHP